MPSVSTAPLNIFNLDLFDPDDIIIPLNYSIADFRNLDSRNGTYSKTISIPSTKKNDTELQYSFDITAEGYYDRNKRCDAILERDGIRLLEGSVQLKEVVMLDGKIDHYEIVLYADNSDWIYLLEGKSIKDLELGSHVYDYDDIIDSWGAVKTTSVHNGDDDFYTYYLVDFGAFETFTESSNVKVENMIPSIFVKQIITKIFKDIGYFVESNFFKRPEIRDLNLLNPKGFVLSSEEVNRRSFKVGSTVAVNTIISQTGQTNPVPLFPSLNVPLDNENFADGFFDNGTATNGNYDNTLYQFIPDNAGKYNLKMNLDFTVDIYAGGVDFLMTSGSLPELELNILNNSVPIHTETIILGSGVLDGSTFINRFTDRIIITVDEEFTLANADVVELRLTLDGNSGNYTSPVSTPVITDWTVKLLGPDTYYENNPLSEIVQGSTVEHNVILPDWSQKDFIKWILQTFNLYIETNNRTKTVTIEPKIEYLKDIQEAEDFSSKVDISLEERIVQIEDDLSRNLTFTYTKDENDDLATQYEFDNDVRFGDKEVTLENEFLSGDKSVADVPWAATIMGLAFRKNTKYQFYIPRLIDNSAVADAVDAGEEPQSFDFEPRLLIYDRAEDVLASWTFESNPQDTIPFAYFVKQASGEFDISLNFESEKNINTSLQLDDTGLVERYYQSTIDQINFGRLYIGYLRLSEIDILNLDFSTPKLLKINGNKTYFDLNKVIDYMAGKNESTEVELVQRVYGQGNTDN